MVFTNTRHESSHNKYPIKTIEQTAIASFYFIFEFISVSVRVRCSNQLWLTSNGIESTVDLLTVCESRFEAINTI